MMIILIILIAAAILVYFSFSGGKETKPTLTAEKEEDSSVGAVVNDKYIGEGVARRGSYPIHTVVFGCDDGEDREFAVSRALYETISVGERDTLVYNAGGFIGFGDHGAVEEDGPQDGGDGFTLDDYDESIDIEMDIAEPGQDGGFSSPEDKEHFEMFLDREKLPPKNETIEDETESFADYSALKLLEKTAAYPFLKRESAVQDMFLRTYREAVDDLLGYDGNSREGKAADSVFINKNEIRAVITIRENPAPLPVRITAEFGVNE